MARLTLLHRLDLKIQSVVKYIPNGEEDDSEFLGVDSVSANTFKSARKSQGERSRQVEIQRADADARRVIWDAEDLRMDADAEGEDDPDFVNDSGVAFVEPLGVRISDDSIRPLTDEDIEAADAMECDGNEPFLGKPDFEPERLGQLVSVSVVAMAGQTADLGLKRDHRLQLARGTLEPTQLLDATQIVTTPIQQHNDTTTNGTDQHEVSRSGDDEMEFG